MRRTKSHGRWLTHTEENPSPDQGTSWIQGHRKVLKTVGGSGLQCLSHNLSLLERDLGAHVYRIERWLSENVWEKQHQHSLETVRNANFQAHSRSIKWETLGVTQKVCVFISPPGVSEAKSSLQTTTVGLIKNHCSTPPSTITTTHALFITAEWDIFPPSEERGQRGSQEEV